MTMGKSLDLIASGARRPRTKAEQSDATRQMLIDAALQVLQSRGYAGATIAAIRDAAGLSNGAFDHHFPTKGLLMAAVLDRISERLYAADMDAMSSVATPRAALEAMLDLIDSWIHLPDTAAQLDIHLARRNDPELDRLTKPIYERIDQQLRLWFQNVRRAAGIEDQAVVGPFHLMNYAIYRGLTMSLIDNESVEEVKQALQLWRKVAVQILLEQRDN